MSQRPTHLEADRLSRRVAAFVAGMLALAIVAATTAPSRAAATSQGQTVSLRLREASVVEAYEALGKESGVRFHLGDAAPADDLRLSLGLIQEPFWAAVME